MFFCDCNRFGEWPNFGSGGGVSHREARVGRPDSRLTGWRGGGRPDGRLTGWRGSAFPIFGVAFPLKQRPSFDSLCVIGSLGKALSVLPFCQDSIKRNTALFSRESVSVRLRGKRKEEYVNIEGSGHIDDAPPGYCRCAARKMVAFLFPLRTDDAGVSAGAFSDS